MCNSLPYMTDGIPGIGGEIKAKPSDFRVIEVPTYLPSGEGQHIYITFTREGLNTKDIAKKLSKVFEITERDIGYAGLKDKHAVTTQTLSLDVGVNFDIAKAKSLIEEHLPEISLENISRHTNKLKLGHLKGNRFEIILRGAECDRERIQKMVDIINHLGIPNYYGEQRFGSKGDNWIRGRDVLLGKKRVKHFQRKLMISSFQSKLFNEWVITRIKRNQLQEIEGDVVINGNIMGPIFGEKMILSSKNAESLEEEIMQTYEVTREDFNKARLPGARREMMLMPKDLSFETLDDGVLFSFELPKGSYATTLIREFQKN